MNVRTLEKRAISEAERRGHTLSTTNIYLYPGWECDVISVSHMNEIVEYEIKRTKNDFLADFLKEEKHYQTSNGYGANQFYFVVPEHLVNANEVPEYAGLIWCKSMGGSWIKKKAPQLHQNKMDFNQLKKIAERIQLLK